MIHSHMTEKSQNKVSTLTLGHPVDSFSFYNRGPEPIIFNAFTILSYSTAHAALASGLRSALLIFPVGDMHCIDNIAVGLQSADPAFYHVKHEGGSLVEVS